MSEQEHTAGSRRRWWLWAAGGVVVVAAVAGAIALANPGTSSASTEPTSSASDTASVAGPAPATSPTGSPTVTPSPAAAPVAPGADATTSAGAPSAAAQVTVPIDSEAQIAPGVTVKVSSLEAVTGSATQPGEIGGPALSATITVTNTSAAPVDLRGAVVNLSYGADSTPASPISNPGGSPFPQSVAAGQTATGVYVFTVPDAGRDVVRIEVDSRVDGQIPVFEGSAPH